MRIAPWAAHQPVKEQLGDVDQHQADEDFVGVEAGFQECRNAGKQSTADSPHNQHQRQNKRRLPLRHENRQHGAADRPHSKLTLGADIPVVGAIADRQPHRDQDQGGRLDCQFVQRPDFQQRLDEKAVQCVDGVLAQHPEHNGAGNQRQNQGQNGRENRKQAGCAGASFKLNAHWQAPSGRCCHGYRPSAGQSFPATNHPPDRAWTTGLRK